MREVTKGRAIIVDKPPFLMTSRRFKILNFSGVSNSTNPSFFNPSIASQTTSSFTGLFSFCCSIRVISLISRLPSQFCQTRFEV